MDFEFYLHVFFFCSFLQSYSFGSELSCVVGEEVLTLGGSIDCKILYFFSPHLNSVVSIFLEMNNVTPQLIHFLLDSYFCAF